MSDRPRQLNFDLDSQLALGREDFFVSPANAVAAGMIGKAMDLPGRKLVVYGPAASGKTHLAHVWAAQTDGRIIAATDLAEADVPDLARQAIAVEDVPLIAGDAARERALFHLHNMVAANGYPLLLTGRSAPSEWGVKLPDLHSRIAAATAAALDEPDDALLTAVLAKLFADRQLVPRPDVIPYLLMHMDRSFTAAADIVGRMDTAALTESRALTRPLAARLLGSSSATE